ncbi:aspartate kinase [Vibrio makurazakiensis]|uniref:aspartate kinase n=1 Tax=Vibrio makurazakiensis TaxID=2910250 RepID=UPI003D0A0FF3
MKMPVIVQKFGGTSVGSIERIQEVAKQIIKAKNEGNQMVVVVSAMSGETNRLMDLATQVDSVPNARELDVLLTAGEQVSMALLSMAINKLGNKATSLTGLQAGITTDSLHNDATIRSIDTQNILRLLNDDHIVIVAGFQGVNEQGDITTLGRGGSDTSAVALAGALDATECQIYTDVDGIYTCDPRIVSNSQKLEVIDFLSMEEMARCGAKVLHLPCVQYAWKHNVALRVLSSFEGGEGTLVVGDKPCERIQGIAIQRDMTQLSILNSELPILIDLCRMLGIEAQCVIQDAEKAIVIVKRNASAKLELVFEEKIRNSEDVSLLTIVGNQAQGIASNSHGLLSAQSIDVFYHSAGSQSLMLVLSPIHVDAAANILHDAYITAYEPSYYQQKEVHFG